MFLGGLLRLWQEDYRRKEKNAMTRLNTFYPEPSQPVAS
jgi:hypothetical protein